MISEDYIEKLKQIDFFKDNIHPELMPFVGNNYSKYKVLHIGESHFIPNYFEAGFDKYGNPHLLNEITLKDFEGWWEGKYSKALREKINWYDTQSVIKDYMDGKRTKAHGIFTNTLKSFCNVVVSEEAFDSITTEDSKKYNYFAYMNFYQQPSIYANTNFTKSLYKAGYFVGKNTVEIDELWYEIFDKSVEIIEKVIDILNPKVIVVTSSEIEKYYRQYGSIDEYGKRTEGKYYTRKNIIWLDHPGTSWWNRRKKDSKSSKERFEERLKEIYNA
ncbi:MAG: hypothetical protein IKS48_08815 [Eubacterium sp.]|nr:hypothetical protein [Eubacterium sp.]